MYLSTYNPNRSFDLGFHSFRGFDSLIDRLFNDVGYSTARHFNIDETDDQYTMNLELPGFKQGDLEVTLEDGVLQVSAKRGERSYQQSVTIPRGVDVDKIEARLEDGLLSIVLPKSQLAKPRKIAIK